MFAKLREMETTLISYLAAAISAMTATATTTTTHEPLEGDIHLYFSDKANFTLPRVPETAMLFRPGALTPGAHARTPADLELIGGVGPVYRKNMQQPATLPKC